MFASFKEYKKAIEAFGVALEILTSLHGDNDIGVAEMNKLIGVTLTQAGKVEEGVAFL